jgi:hypothetical protein
MKIAGALACAALVLYPVVGSAEIKPAIQVPPGWAKHAVTRPHDHAWRRGQQFLDLDTQTNDTGKTLEAYVHDIILPSSNGHGTHVMSSVPTTTCMGQQKAWLVTISLSIESGNDGVLETVFALSGTNVYEASYIRPSTEPPRADAERAIRSLCLMQRWTSRARG